MTEPGRGLMEHKDGDHLGSFRVDMFSVEVYHRQICLILSCTQLYIHTQTDGRCCPFDQHLIFYCITF